MNKVGKRPGSEQPNVLTEYPDREAASLAPAAGAVDRPGFDLGGSLSGATAGTGLGLGKNALEGKIDQGLSGRRGRTQMGLPRFSGAVKADD